MSHWRKQDGKYTKTINLPDNQRLLLGIDFIADDFTPENWHLLFKIIDSEGTAILDTLYEVPTSLFSNQQAVVDAFISEGDTLIGSFDNYLMRLTTNGEILDFQSFEFGFNSLFRIDENQFVATSNILGNSVFEFESGVFNIIAENIFDGQILFFENTDNFLRRNENEIEKVSSVAVENFIINLSNSFDEVNSVYSVFEETYVLGVKENEIIVKVYDAVGSEFYSFNFPKTNVKYLHIYGSGNHFVLVGSEPLTRRPFIQYFDIVNEGNYPDEDIEFIGVDILNVSVDSVPIHSEVMKYTFSMSYDFEIKNNGPDTLKTFFIHSPNPLEGANCGTKLYEEKHANLSIPTGSNYTFSETIDIVKFQRPSFLNFDFIISAPNGHLDRDYFNNAATSLFNTGDFLSSNYEEILNSKRRGIKLFPNPTNGLLNISSNHDLINYTINFYRMDGGLVEQLIIDPNGMLDISSFSAGVYFYEVVDEKSGRIENGKIIKL